MFICQLSAPDTTLSFFSGCQSYFTSSFAKIVLMAEISKILVDLSHLSAKIVLIHSISFSVRSTITAALALLQHSKIGYDRVYAYKEVAF